MRLQATLTAKELRQTLHSLLPLRIALDDDAEDQQHGTRRWLDIHELLEDRLVAEEGYMVSTRASITWPERVIFEAFDVRRVDVLLRPQLVSTPSGRGLSVRLQCAEIDIAWFPDFVDRAIVERINERLRKAGIEFRWDFSETLTFSFTETSAKSNIAELTFDLSTADLQISSDELRLGGPMEVRLDRRPPRELEREPMAALPQPSA